MCFYLQVHKFLKMCGKGALETPPAVPLASDDTYVWQERAKRHYGPLTDLAEVARATSAVIFFHKTAEIMEIQVKPIFI